MELLSSSSRYLLPISGFLLSLLLLYKLIIPIRNPKSKTPSNLPPEPPGGLPIIGHLLHFAISRKTLARTFADMADRHGPVFSVRLGVHRVAVVSDAATIQECFTAQDRALASRPKSSQAEHLTYNYAGFAAAPYGSYWRDVRKVAVTQLLSAHRLKSLGHVQASEIGMLMKELYLLCLQGNDEPENRGGGSSVVVVVISELFQQLTSNSITRLIAGRISLTVPCNPTNIINF
ncbi:unnamed protein product [Linum tenue]|uniref:Cytochrome P450 n=2 Tax=Linum tenue TaxID=586396 RepID=A0AAV0KZA9_9ROSI|nr:unnamed protein product [Linum tenue]